MGAKLTPLQSVRLFGWLNPRPVLRWDDVRRMGLTFDQLIGVGVSASELVAIQPDPAEWVQHAGVELKHARAMMRHWPANPFTHMRADLGDVLSQKFSADELGRMDVSYAQLVRYGMTERTEPMFRFDAQDWLMLGRPSICK